jgi:hypothetical protein
MLIVCDPNVVERKVRHMRSVKAVYLMLGLILLTSCSGQGVEQQAKPQEPAAKSAQPEPAKPAPPAPVAVEPAPAAAPALAVADGELPGLKAEIHELKRTGGDTLTLKFSIANGSAKDMNFSYDFGEKDKTGDYNSIGGVHLIDAEAKKKYFVVRDAEGQCACSRDLKAVNPGSRSQLWAKFPAPPETVQKITIVVPHFLPVEDVPISR